MELRTEIFDISVTPILLIMLTPLQTTIKHYKVELICILYIYFFNVLRLSQSFLLGGGGSSKNDQRFPFF